MYNEVICETIPILISNEKEHNRQQLARCASYYELHGDTKKVEEIRERIRYI